MPMEKIRSTDLTNLCTSNTPPNEIQRTSLQRLLDVSLLLFKDLPKDLNWRDALASSTFKLEASDYSLLAITTISPFDVFKILHPIRRVPVEILQEIFLFANSGATTGPPNSFDPKGTPWRLSHVCRIWKSAACGCPDLWRSVSIVINQKMSKRLCDTALLLLSRQISRAGYRDLSVTLRDYDGKRGPLQHSILTAIVCVLPLARHLCLAVRFSSLPYLSFAYPYLSSLRSIDFIPQKGVTREEEHVSALLNLLESIRTDVELQTAPEVWGLVNSVPAERKYPHILSFRGHENSSFDISLAFAILQRLSHLETGAFIVRCPLPSNLSLTHHTLETLYLIDYPGLEGSSMQFLEQITLPSLNSLFVSALISIHSISTFLERSSCCLQRLVLFATSVLNVRNGDPSAAPAHVGLLDYGGDEIFLEALPSRLMELTLENFPGRYVTPILVDLLSRDFSSLPELCSLTISACSGLGDLPARVKESWDGLCSTE